MTEGVTALRRVAKKEFRGFFAGPAAYLFIGGFLLACLFSVFWVETFFARNIADVRPLFQWLPLLLIFLVAALYRGIRGAGPGQCDGIRPVRGRVDRRRRAAMAAGETDSKWPGIRQQLWCRRGY